VHVRAIASLLGLGLLLTACGNGGGAGQTYGSPQSIASALGCSEVGIDLHGQDYDQEICTHQRARISI
jgi:hypothetical protein